ncbi:MAG: hypothetical protein QXK74_08420 [Candidatus Nitrosocaldaceae archaeon]
MKKFQAGKKSLSYMPITCINLYCTPTSLFQKQVVHAGLVIATYIQQGAMNKWYLNEKYLTNAVNGLKVLYRMLCEKYGIDNVQEWLEKKFMEGKEKYGLWNYNIITEGEDLITDIEKLLDAFCRHLIAWSRLDDSITDKMLTKKNEGGEKVRAENESEREREKEMLNELADHTGGLLTNLSMAINRMILYVNLQNIQETQETQNKSEE